MLTMGEIRKVVKEKVREGLSFDGAYDSVRQFIIGHFSTLEAKEIFEKSPQRHLGIEGATDLLMAEVGLIIVEEMESRE